MKYTAPTADDRAVVIAWVRDDLGLDPDKIAEGSLVWSLTYVEILDGIDPYTGERNRRTITREVRA